MTNNIKDLRAKLLIIGDSHVGKSSILANFTDQTFHHHMAPTYGKFFTFSLLFISKGIDYRIKKVQVNNETIKLEIWDTAGQEKFRSIGRNFYRNCMGIVIAFDLTNRESFNNIERWLKSLNDETDDNVIKVIVGNKMDLKREIKKEEVNQLIGSNYPFFETSAKTGEGIKEMFEFITKKVYKKFLANLNDSIIGDPSINMSPPRMTLTGKGVEETTKDKKKKCCLFS